MKKSVYIKCLNKKLDLIKLLKSLNISPNTIAYLGGSAIEGSICDKSTGMGNKLSDLDLFIILPNEEFYAMQSDYSTTTEKNAFISIDNVSLDITYYKMEDIDSLTLFINNLEIDNNKKVLGMLNQSNGWDADKVNEIINRLIHSIPIQNEELYNNLIKSINLKKFCTIFHKMLITSIDNLIIDIQGNLDANQIDTALYCAREAYLRFMKSIIYKKFDTVDRDKWIPLKVYNLKSKNIDKVTQTYYNLFYRIDKHTARQIITDSVIFINDYILNEDEEII